MKLMTEWKSPTEALDNLYDGSWGSVDLLIKDIFGGFANQLPIDNELIASSCAKLHLNNVPVKDKDLAKSLMLAIMFNTIQDASMLARL